MLWFLGMSAVEYGSSSNSSTEEAAHQRHIRSPRLEKRPRNIVQNAAAVPQTQSTTSLSSTSEALFLEGETSTEVGARKQVTHEGVMTGGRKSHKPVRKL